MKAITLSLVFALIGIAAFAQAGSSQSDSLIDEGISRHQMALYSDAILFFKKALDLNPRSSRASCELAFTLLTVKDYGKAIQYARRSLYEGDQKIPEAFTIWATALDESGKAKKALEILGEGIRIFPSEYLLWYNLGYSQYTRNKYVEAKTAFAEAVRLNPGYPGNHLMLGLTEQQLGERLEAMLPLFVFLILEPSSDRSQSVWESLVNMQDRGAAGLGRKNSTQILKTFSETASQLPADTSILLKFAERNKILFSLLPPGDDEMDSLYNSLYLPLFRSLAENNNTAAFSFYISQAVRTQEARDWFATNPEQTDQFANWLSRQEFLR